MKTFFTCLVVLTYLVIYGLVCDRNHNFVALRRINFFTGITGVALFIAVILWIWGLAP